MKSHVYRLLAAAIVCWVLLGSRAAHAASPHGHGHHADYHHHVDHHGHHGPYVYRSYGPSYYRYAYPYGVTLGGPIFVDPRTVVGPQAMRRFLGFNGFDGRRAVVAPPMPRRARPDEPQQARREPRKSNAASRGRARRFVELGDSQFAAQRYHRAVQRYKKAISSAPDVAAGYFRRGHAELAMGHYERAAKSYKAGLRIDPNWPDAPFRFEDFYDDNVAVRMAHLEALALAAEQDANNADLYFLIGVRLHFSEKPERARLFFERAARLADGAGLARGEVDHLAGFLPGAKHGKQNDAAAF